VNAHAAGRWLDTRTPVDDDARDLLASAAERCGLSARAYHRVLKVARTIADLDDADAVAWTHVAEALRYRPMNPRDGEETAGPVQAVRASASLGPSRLAKPTKRNASSLGRRPSPGGATEPVPLSN
jgi:hypothetical protein